MKIRHVVRGRCNPDNADGIIRHTYQLAHAQLQLGHDVEVYGIASRATAPEVIDRSGLIVRAYPPTRSPVGVHPQLAGLLETDDRDVDMVHLQPPHDPAIWGLGRLLYKSDIPYFLSPHSMWAPAALERHRFRKTAYRLLLDNQLTRRAAGIHATANSETDDIDAYAPWARTFVVRNSVDLASISRSTGDRSFWAGRFDLRESTRVFVFLGRLDPYQKGLDLLMEAMGGARAAGADAVLGLIGPSWRNTEGELEEAISRAGLTAHVSLTGALYGDEKLAALAGADVYVQVSRYETTPYSIIEGLASELPAIVTPGTNFARPVASYDAGWGVDFDVRAVKDAITEAAGVPALTLAEKGANAKRLVEERHSLARAGQRMIEAYRAALSGGRFDDDD